MLMLMKDVTNSLASTRQAALLETVREEVRAEEDVYCGDGLLNSAFRISLEGESITGFSSQRRHGGEVGGATVLRVDVRQGGADV